MGMIVSKNICISGKHQKPILLDLGYQPNQEKKAVVIFAHGFKGFKDWGHFNKVMDYFIKNDFVFVKFNFSHNGGTVEQPIDFPDLEAFGNNNYTIELDDLGTVIDWVIQSGNIRQQEVDLENIYLIGHSRGGGISIVKTVEDTRIKKIVTWASVADLMTKITPSELDLWKAKGVIYVHNSRTNQQMPMYFQFAENAIKNKKRFSIQQSIKKLKVPYLIVHGSIDGVVELNEAKILKQWSQSAELFVVEGADHTFGAKHPFDDPSFPIHFQEVIEKTIQFLKV